MSIPVSIRRHVGSTIRAALDGSVEVSAAWKLQDVSFRARNATTRCAIPVRWQKQKRMSLDVSTALLERAEAGPVDGAEFVACVRDSLPYAWTIISGVADDLRAGGGDFADHEVPPPTEAERGQLLRALASDAIRGGLSAISG